MAGEQANEHGRLGGAVLIAPPIGGAIGFSIAYLILAAFGQSRIVTRSAVEILFNALGMGMFGFVGGVVLGAALFALLWLPAHALLYNIGSRSLPAYLFSGFIFIAPFAFFGALAGQGNSQEIFLLPIPHLCIGAVFWLIRRPDRDAPR